MKTSGVLLASLLVLSFSTNAQNCGNKLANAHKYAACSKPSVENASNVTYRTLISTERPTLGTKWVMERINGETLEFTDVTLDREVPRLEIRLDEMAYYGHDGCNLLSGKLREVNNTDISFGPSVSTKMSCTRKSVPVNFNEALSEVRTYRIKDDRLHMFDASGNEVLVFRKN